MSKQPAETENLIEDKLRDAWRQEQRFFHLRGMARFLIWLVAMVVVDLVIDNCGVEGDACVPVPDSALSVGATSTVTGCLILQMVACRATEMLYAAGTPPDLYQSSNTDNDERNAAIIAGHQRANPHL